MIRNVLVFFRKNQGIFIFITVVIIAGIVSGVFLAKYLDEDSLDELLVTLHHFFVNLKEGADWLAASELLRFSYYINGASLLFIWALGMFSAGFSLVLLVLFFRGLSLGFTLGIIFFRYSVKGLLFCFAAVLPHNLFYMSAYILAGAFAFSHSLYLFKHRMPRMGTIEDQYFRQYCYYMVYVLLAASIGGLMEAYITPSLIRLVLPLILVPK